MDTEIEQVVLKTSDTTNEACLEFGINTMGLFKLYVFLNDRPIKDVFFLESRKNKLQSMDEQLNTTQQSVISQESGFNSSKTSAFIKRPKSSFRLTNVIVKKDNKIVIKNGSIQPMRKSEVAIEELKRPSIKEVLANNKGKLEQYLKAKKTLLPIIKKIV